MVHDTVTDATSSFDRLEEVSKRREEWANLPNKSKIDLLQQVQTILTEELSYDDYRAYGRMGAAIMGYNVARSGSSPNSSNNIERVECEFECTSQALTYVVAVKKCVEDLLFCLRVREGLVSPPSALSKGGGLKTRTAINGQVTVQTFPTLPKDDTGFLGHCTGEVWLDPNYVREESQVEIFSFDKAWRSQDGSPVTNGDDDDANDDRAAKGGGLMVVLGAGNQPALTPLDVLNGMFVRNCVVYVKQHPIREYVNDFIVRAFRPFIDKHYLDVEAHTTNERSAALVYHPAVTAVHMTGGKATHDAIVWGDVEGGGDGKKRTTPPKLKATMTSELGAVSPWIVVPARYDHAAMKAQAEMFAYWIYQNASCNCNSPKCLIVANDWDQKDEFLNLIETTLIRNRLPVAYYPGIERRWTSFATQYPNAKRLESTSGLGIKERGLVAPKLSDKPLLLPYLQITVNVDLDTAEGRAAAKTEYAFRNEPFAPVYTVATLQNTSQTDLDKFCTTASTFCNDYLFGTLSGTVMAAPTILDEPAVQHLIADLRYGGLGVNVWGGMAYIAQASGMWGGYPGEKLDAVQSGIGIVGNFIAVPYIQRFVLTSPIVHPGHSSLKSDLKKEQRLLDAVGKYFLNGSIPNLIKLLSEVAGIDLVAVSVATVSVVAVGVAYAISVRRS